MSTEIAEIVECADCGKEFDPADDSHCEEYRGQYTCGDCLGTFICEDCGKRAYCEDCGDWSHYAKLCEDCFFAKYFKCEVCDKYTEYSEYDNSEARFCIACNPIRDEFWDALVCNDSDSHTTWETWAAIADFAGTVDFGCSFDCNGKCASTRQRKGSDWTNETERACCKSCAGEVGYLRKLPREAVETVRALFDDKIGFWRPAGCALPRKWRSYTCLAYRCHYAERCDRSGGAGYKELRNCFDKGRLPIVSVK